MSRTRSVVKYSAAATATALYGASVVAAYAESERIDRVAAQAAVLGVEVRPRRVLVAAGVLCGLTWLAALA